MMKHKVNGLKDKVLCTPLWEFTRMAEFLCSTSMLCPCYLLDACSAIERPISALLTVGRCEIATTVTPSASDACRRRRALRHAFVIPL